LYGYAQNAYTIPWIHFLFYKEHIMATHFKRVDPAIKSGMYQAFSNDTSLTGAVTFATGDYIDFEKSLNRPAKKLGILINGAVDVTLIFNNTFSTSKFQESEADETVTITEGAASINSIRLFGAASGFFFFETPEGFPIRNLKIVAYSGVASSTTNITFIGY
jgi:hypothetical protein